MQGEGSKQGRSSQPDKPAQEATWTPERGSVWLRLGSLCRLLVRGKNRSLFRAMSWLLQKTLGNTALGFSASRLVRSRPWLSGFVTVCGLLLWVYVDFQPANSNPATPLPADDPVVFDDNGSLDGSGAPVAEVSASESPADLSAMSFAGSSLERRLRRGGFQANQSDENQASHAPRNVPPFESVKNSQKRAVWLTGTIEEVSEATPTERTVRSDRFLPSRK